MSGKPRENLKLGGLIRYGLLPLRHNLSSLKMAYRQWASLKRHKRDIYTALGDRRGTVQSVAKKLGKDQSNLRMWMDRMTDLGLLRKSLRRGREAYEYKTVHASVWKEMKRRIEPEAKSKPKVRYAWDDLHGALG